MAVQKRNLGTGKVTNPLVDGYDQLDDESDFGLTEEDLDYADEDLDDDDEDEDVEEDIPEEDDRILTLDDVLNAPDLDEEEIYIPEWHGKFVIRSVTKTEFDHLRRLAGSKQNRGNRNAILERELIIAGVVKPALTKEGYQRLLNRSAGPLLDLLNAIYRKSGLERTAELARERRFPKK
jgi:hypothetical protein